jgi:hypothetical protein
MSSYKGDFPTGKTIYFYFDTFAGSTGAPITISGLATSDIKVYKNGSTTERSSTAGFTLLDTDGIDFDGITGIHGFSIDTSDDTDAGFYAAGNDYTVVVSTITVDSQTMSFIAGSFSIDNRQLLRPTTASRTLDVSAGGEAGIDWSNIGSPTTAVNLSGTTVKTATDVETDTADIQGRLPAALVGGKIDSNVGTISNNAITTASINDGAITNAKVADDVDVNVKTVTAGAITASAIATDAIDADALAADAVAEVKAALIALSIDGFDLEEAMRLILAMAVGKASGMATATNVFRDAADTKDRITATTDADGNRSAVTLDAS